MNDISREDRFLFDLQGFLLLKGALSADECRALLDTVEQLKERTYEDAWVRKVPHGSPLPACDRRVLGQLRFNGLLRLDPAFDILIDHPAVLPYLQAFQGQPQLINTWAIEKTKGSDTGVWHRGIAPTEYSFRDGMIRTRMLNVIYFLTDNGAEDGCVVAIPGSHKNNIDLDWETYRGLEMPGAVAVTGRAGDVFLFSEAVVHNGLPKTTGGARTNLYFNYAMRDFNVMIYEPHNTRHFCMPPSIRQRFTPRQQAVTQWMEFAQWQE